MQRILETIVTIFGDVLDQDDETFICVEAAQFERSFGPFAGGEHVEILRLQLREDEVWLEELESNGEEFIVRRKVRVMLAEYK
jgi:hypothetical protein